MAKLNLNTAEQLREQITAEQQKQIEAMYKKVSRQVAAQAKKAPRVPSDRLRQYYLNELQKQLDAQMKQIGQELEGTITGNMGRVANSVCEANLDFLTQAGMPIAGAFSHVPDEIIRAIVTGTVYEGNWSLSTSIWRGTRKAQEDIRSIIAAGVAENKSAYDIAKDLEKYVNPTARKPWDWNKVYPGTAKKVDYNAQRLARTMVSHAYQQSFVQTTQKNPFVTEYVWLASNSDHTCDICAERDGKHFPKDDLPMDHPNGMCTFEAVIPDSMTDIADRLADWAEGKDDPQLDEWAKDLYGEKWGQRKDEYKPDPYAGLTKKQAERAKEWDEAYERVVEFAKETGRPIDRTVKEILGNPPKGSIHAAGAPVPQPKARIKQPIKSDFKESDAKIQSRAEANAYVKSMIQKAGYSQKGLQSIEDYTMFSDDMNGYLRGLIGSNEYGSSIQTLHQTMKTGPQEIVYRGCDSKTLGISPALSEEQIKDRLIGKVLHEKGFMSVTHAFDVAQEFSDRGIDGDYSELPTVITMRVNSDVGRVYANSGLGEMILDKGQHLTVLDARIEKGVLRVLAEVSK